MYKYTKKILLNDKLIDYENTWDENNIKSYNIIILNANGESF